MPKLPDFTAFGQEPTPNIPGGRPRGATYQPTSGAEGAVGKGLQVLGGSIMQVDKDLEHFDNTRAENAFTQLRSKQIDMSVGDNGFAKIKGGDAVNKPIMQDYLKEFDGASKNISEGLSNDRQRKMFLRRADISRLQFQQDILNHVTREKDAYARQTFQGTLDSETSIAVERYQDTSGIGLSLGRIEAAINAEAERTGAAPEAVQALKRDASSKVYRGVIERHLANDDDLSATAQYQKVKNTLNSEDTIAVERALEIGSTRGAAQRAADAAISKSNGDLGLALEKVRKISDPKVREAASANVRNMISENEAAIKLAKDQAFTTAMQYVQEYGDVQRIPPHVQVALSPTEMATMDKMALEKREKRTPTTDINAWTDFNEKSRDRNWLATLSDADFTTKYLMNFDEQKRDRASALRDAAKEAAKGDAKAKDFLRNDINLGEMVKANVFRSGIVDPTKRPADYSTDEKVLMADIEVQASKALEDFQVKNKRKATTEEEEQVVRSLLLPHTKVKISGGWLWDSTKTLGELAPEEMGKAYIKYDKIPPDERTFLENRSRALGAKDINEDRIAKAYALISFRNDLTAAQKRAMVDTLLRGQ